MSGKRVSRKKTTTAGTPTIMFFKEIAQNWKNLTSQNRASWAIRYGNFSNGFINYKKEAYYRRINAIPYMNGVAKTGTDPICKILSHSYNSTTKTLTITTDNTVTTSYRKTIQFKNYNNNNSTNRKSSWINLFIAQANTATVFNLTTQLRNLGIIINDNSMLVLRTIQNRNSTLPAGISDEYRIAL